MKFDDFIKEGKVRKSYKDLQMVKALIKGVDNDLDFLKNIEINEVSARKVMVNYYDVLRTVLEAISILKGFKIYAHEAFTYFLISLDEIDLSDKFDRFRKLRNGINYYGKSISPSEVFDNKESILFLINELRKKYLKIK